MVDQITELKKESFSEEEFLKKNHWINQGASSDLKLSESKPSLDNEGKNPIKEKFMRTGIMGFDDLITNGIPIGSQILIAGGPGTSKSTFCLQMLSNNAKQGKTCLFLSFEESKENILRNMKNFGFDMSEVGKKLVIQKMDPFQMSRSVETLLAQARGELLIEVNEAKNLIPQGMMPDIIVIDSLSAISAGFFGKEEGYRAYMSQIFDTFRNLGATAFMITEIEHSTTKYSKSGVEEFLADGVFVYYNLRQGNERINATEIVKLRGTEHKKRIVPFKVIPGAGLTVYPTEELFVSE